jgi:hypothetical protein
MMRGPMALLFLAASLAAASCGPTVDLSTGLQVLDVSTGWKDAGLEGGQNKLVPSITFKLKNVSDQELNSLQANVVFRRNGEPEEWGTVFLIVTGSDGLDPGATSETLVAVSPLGYTGTEARAEMLQNSQFVDAHAEIFAKYGSTLLKKVADHPIDRQLLTP